MQPIVTTLSDRIDADVFSVLSIFEFNHSVDKSVKSIIASSADIVARMEFGASLTDEDIAGKNRLSVAPLHSQSLSRRISAVFGRAAALFVSK